MVGDGGGCRVVAGARGPCMRPRAMASTVRALQRASHRRSDLHCLVSARIVDLVRTDQVRQGTRRTQQHQVSYECRLRCIDQTQLVSTITKRDVAHQRLSRHANASALRSYHLLRNGRGLSACNSLLSFRAAHHLLASMSALCDSVNSCVKYLCLFFFSFAQRF